MSVLIEFVLVAVGGAVGGVARYGLSVAVDRRTGRGFPWGTLLVNVSGAFVIGALAGWTGTAVLEGESSRLWVVLAIGVLGSYTTVSSFSLQVVELARGGRGVRAVWYVVGSFGLCLLAAAAGLAVLS